MARTKKDTLTADETPATEQAATADPQIAAILAQNRQMLDMLVEANEKIDALEAARADAPTFTPEARSKVESELNAELEALKDEFADYPQIQMFEQRVVIGQEASADIRLKQDPSVVDDPANDSAYWKLRWVNTAKQNRAQQMSVEGYVQVTWDELQDRGMVPGGANLDTYVRRGDRGTEVLYKIPKKLHDYKQRRDALRRSGQLSSESFVRDHVANGVSKVADSVGDNSSQAGDFAHGLQMTITPGAKETVTF